MSKDKENKKSLFTVFCAGHIVVYAHDQADAIVVADHAIDYDGALHDLETANVMLTVIKKINTVSDLPRGWDPEWPPYAVAEAHAGRVSECAPPCDEILVPLFKNEDDARDDYRNLAEKIFELLDESDNPDNLLAYINARCCRET